MVSDCSLLMLIETTLSARILLQRVIEALIFAAEKGGFKVEKGIIG